MLNLVQHPEINSGRCPGRRILIRQLADRMTQPCILSILHSLWYPAATMSDVEEVKSRLNIVDIVQARVPLKKAGRNFKGLCPFHSEKSPSFMVSPERQAFHCFGCGKGGSVIDFVMEMEHLSFIEALEDLAEKAGVKLTHKASDSQEDQQRQKIFEVNHLASEYYQYVLTKHAL